MRIPDWLILASAYGSILGAVAFCAWAASQIIDVWDILRRRRKFSEDVRAALENNQPSWQQVQDFGVLRRLSQHDIGCVLRELVRDGLTGKAADLQAHLGILEGYLSTHKASEPFEGMPSEIRVHLERLKKQGKETEVLLESLTAQIRDLLIVKSRDYSRQKLYTVGGFVIGLIGLLFAGYTYFYPPDAPSSKKTPANATAQ